MRYLDQKLIICVGFSKPIFPFFYTIGARYILAVFCSQPVFQACVSACYLQNSKPGRYVSLRYREVWWLTWRRLLSAIAKFYLFS